MEHVTDFVPELSVVQEMVGRGSIQTVLSVGKNVARMAVAEQHHQERRRISVRGRHVWRLRDHMRGVVHSVPDGRTEKQPENGTFATRYENNR